ncbi:MAG: DUF2142 domain-containing protein [Lachnospiraceae bacterium]|nr:DUF2142 domain-containing protein [Lachnospiraceae bacterium]
MKWTRNREMHLPEISKDFKKLAVILLASAVLAFGAERLIALIFYSGDVFFWGRYAAAFVILELTALFVCYREIVARKVEIAVLVVLLSIGTLYATVIPASTGISWDDEWHYYYPMLLSHLLSPSITEAELYYMNNFTDTSLEERKGYDRESRKELYQEVDDAYRPEEEALIDRTWPRYRLWCYIPAAFGLWLGRLLSLPYHMTFMLGRWCNLLFYAILVFLALRKLKSGKMLAAVIALLPFNIFMAASYSYDPWITAWLLYGLCSFFGELQQPDQRMTWREWACILFAFFMGVGPKLLYIPLVLLILFLPKEKFVSQKQRRIMILAVALLLIFVSINLIFSYVVSSGGIVQDNRGGDEVDAGGQIAYIFSHPWTYTKILLKFLAEYISVKSACMYAAYLHYFTNLQPALFAPLIVVTLIVVTFTDKEECDTRISVFPRIAALALSFAVLCLLATSMYVAFTEVGNDEILGCQYRYIAPIMFPALYALGSGKLPALYILKGRKYLSWIRREYYNGLILAVCAFVSMHAVWAYAITPY